MLSCVVCHRACGVPVYAILSRCSTASRRLVRPLQADLVTIRHLSGAHHWFGGADLPQRTPSAQRIDGLDGIRQMQMAQAGGWRCETLGKAVLQLKARQYCLNANSYLQHVQELAVPHWLPLQ